MTTTPLRQQMTAIRRSITDLEKDLVRVKSKLTAELLECMSLTEKEEWELLEEDTLIDINSLKDAIATLEAVQALVQTQSQLMELAL